MKCIAIDDEPLALEIIGQFCERFGGLELTVFSDPVVGLQQVNRICPDILFLDIEMNGVSGLDIARNLPEGVFLIFTTAYSQFALEGFELNATDFLHKPFSFSRFSKAVEKAIELKKLYDLSDSVSDDGEITVRVEYQNVRIPVSSISYIEAMDSYVKIHTREPKPVITQMSMKAIKDLLPANEFVRIHKSFIVNAGKISGYSKNKVVISSKGVELPVGRVYASAFSDFMEGNDCNV